MSAPSNIGSPGSDTAGSADRDGRPAAPQASAGSPSALVRGRRPVLGRLVVVLGVLLAVAGMVLLVPRPNAVPLQTVDIAAAASSAGPQLGFPPSVPSGLPGWTATTALVRHGTDGILTWHVGFITPQGNYAGLEQATRSDFTWENALDSGGLWVGTVTVDGRAWDHREKAERDTTALILRRPGRVTLVTAKGGGVADAVALIRSLPADTLS